MPASTRPIAPFQLGAWCVDPATGQLTRGDDVRRARALVAELLLFLVAHAGEVVTKDDLVAGPWGGAAIADSALTSTIAELRELLDDQPRSPRYIETLPKRGYRLIAPVGLPESTSAQPATAPPALNPAIAAAPHVAIAATPDVATPEVAAVTAASVPAPAASPDHPRWSRRSWTLAFVIGAAFAIAVTVSIASRRRPVDPSPRPRPMRFTIDLPTGVRLAPYTAPRLALNADGSRMAYVVRATSGPAIYTRLLDQFESTPVGGTNGAMAPFFSPDGSRVGFFADGELRTVPISGGRPSVVCEARVPLGASWAPDGAIVFSGTHGLALFEAPASGGPPRPLTTLDASRGELSHRWPQVTPDGSHVLFTAIGHGRADVLVFSRRSGEQHVVVEDAQTAMFVAPNRIMFERNGRLMLATMDPLTFELTGPARVVVEDAVPSGPGFGSPLFAIASGGALVYAPIDPHDIERDLVWVDRAGRATSIGAPPRSYMHPRLSPDERQIVSWFRVADADLWQYDLTSRALTRLVTGVGARRPAWSPDGLRVMFDAPSSTNPVTLYEADVRGGRAWRLRGEGNSQYAGAWMPDGRAIAFVDLKRATGFDIVTMGDEPHAAATPVLRSVANETAPAFSPDGRWLAFVSDTTGHEEVYLLRYPQGGAPVQVSVGGGREPVWSRRGDELFFRAGQSLLVARVAAGENQPRVSEPVALFTGDFDQWESFLPNYDVADDGRFLMVRGTAPSTTDTRIAAILRWDAP